MIVRNESIRSAKSLIEITIHPAPAIPVQSGSRFNKQALSVLDTTRPGCRSETRIIRVHPRESAEKKLPHPIRIHQNLAGLAGSQPLHGLAEIFH